MTLAQSVLSLAQPGHGVGSSFPCPLAFGRAALRRIGVFSAPTGCKAGSYGLGSTQASLALCRFDYLARFSPIPDKIFTIAAGTIFMPTVPFILALANGRGTRFFMVAGLMRWGGARMESMPRTHINRLG